MKNFAESVSSISSLFMIKVIKQCWEEKFCKKPHWDFEKDLGVWESTNTFGYM